ncbi:unnamed protein product [Parajaminaea phylloscopi]
MAPKKTAAPAPAKKGTKKDKSAPKRALSAYMFFSQDQRERTKSENPTATFGEIGRILGATWKEMSDAQKKPYIDMAERDKKRAEDEKASYKKRKDESD